MKNTRSILLCLALATGMGAATAQDKGNTVMVGGEAMYPMKDIVANAVNSKDHTTLVAAVQAAGLVGTLQGPGPFTVLAPTNAAFAALPAGTVDGLLKPEAKEKLTTVLTYHVLAGRFDAKSIKAAIKKGDGTATMRTVAGQELSFRLNGPNNITVWDASGRYANITIYDVFQSNGVIHVLDTVLLPKG